MNEMQITAKAVAEMKRLAMVKHRGGTSYRDALDLVACEHGYAGWRQVAEAIAAAMPVVHGEQA